MQKSIDKFFKRSMFNDNFAQVNKEPKKEVELLNAENLILKNSIIELENDKQSTNNKNFEKKTDEDNEKAVNLKASYNIFLIYK